MKQKFLRKSVFQMILVFCLCMVGSFGLLVIQVAAAETTEKKSEEAAGKENTYSCGSKCTAVYNEASKTLTVKGSGLVEGSDELRELDVEKIVFKSGITKLGSYSFSNFKKLKSVSLPDSVTYLEAGAFSDCSALSTIILPNKLKKISYYAFYCCQKLKQIEIPASVRTVGSNAFSNTGLTSIEVPTTVKNLGSRVFSGCENLKSVQYGLSKIPSGTFDDCHKLNKITYLKKVTSIGGAAFEDTGFKTFKMPDSVTDVGSYAFAYCRKLVKLTCSKNMKTVPSSLVYNSKVLKKVILKNGTTTISRNAFSYSYVKYISIPETVTVIGAYAFNGSYGLTSIKLPSKIKTIYNNTFNSCKELQKIILGSGVTKIGESAFEDCSALKDITIPKNVDTIDYRAFYHSGVTSVTFANGVKTIGYWAFSECNKLKTVKVPASMVTVRENAFAGCDKLTDIQISTGNAAYSSYDGAMYTKGRTKLICCPSGKKGTFTIPASVRKLNEYSFYSCTKITNFAVAEGSSTYAVKNGIVYNKAFTKLVCSPAGRTGGIQIPFGVKKIGDYAFQGSKASYISLPDSLTQIGYCAFENCSQIRSIKIPGSVHTIPAAAFWQCEKLRSVELESGVKRIQRVAFNECSNLKMVRVPMSVQYISESAFRSCRYSLTFYCSKISYALTYANKQGISYKIV